MCEECRWSVDVLQSQYNIHGNLEKRSHCVGGRIILKLIWKSGKVWTGYIWRTAGDCCGQGIKILGFIKCRNFLTSSGSAIFSKSVRYRRDITPCLQCFSCAYSLAFLHWAWSWPVWFISSWCSGLDSLYVNEDKMNSYKSQLHVLYT
jgi:hypothetical protein